MKAMKGSSKSMNTLPEASKLKAPATSSKSMVKAGGKAKKVMGGAKAMAYKKGK